MMVLTKDATIVRKLDGWILSACSEDQRGVGLNVITFSIYGFITSHQAQFEPTESLSLLLLTFNKLKKRFF